MHGNMAVSFVLQRGVFKIKTLNVIGPFLRMAILLFLSWYYKRLNLILFLSWGWQYDCFYHGITSDQTDFVPFLRMAIWPFLSCRHVAPAMYARMGAWLAELNGGILRHHEFIFNSENNGTIKVSKTIDVRKGGVSGQISQSKDSCFSAYLTILWKATYYCTCPLIVVKSCTDQEKHLMR